MNRLFVLSASAFALSACSLLGADPAPLFEPGGLLQTDRTRYDAKLLTDGRARVVFDVPFIARNPTDEPLYLIGCHRPPPPLLEKLVDGEWEVAYGAVVPLCLSPPFEIPPGGERRDTLRVVGFLPGQNTMPTFDTAVEGTYRLRWEIYAGQTDEDFPVGGDLLPLEQQVSNTFEVR